VKISAGPAVIGGDPLRQICILSAAPAARACGSPYLSITVPVAAFACRL
jgi:hypothetical protein